MTLSENSYEWHDKQRPSSHLALYDLRDAKNMDGRVFCTFFVQCDKNYTNTDAVINIWTYRTIYCMYMTSFIFGDAILPIIFT